MRQPFTLAVIGVVSLVTVPRPLFAQNGAAARAAATITEGDVRRRIEIIAHDSMGGRATPSRGLSMTASYIASEFARFGLQPAGDSGSFIQTYPLDRMRVDTIATHAVLRVGGTSARLSASRDLAFLAGDRTGVTIDAPVVLAAGALSADGTQTEAIEGKILVILDDSRAANSANRNQFLRTVAQQRPAAILSVSNADSATFARQLAWQVRERVAPRRVGTPVVVVSVREVAVAEVLRAAGIDVAALRASPTLVLRPVPALSAALTVANDGPATIPAPNVVGVLEGSDPVLRNEYIVFSAHMDHDGIGPPVKGDSIWNGADDDASGTAGVVELAEAYATPDGRPRRSMIFLTVSGEEKGLWGSDYFAANLPVPRSQVVANINLDMIGRNWTDTIVVIGKEHSDLGATLERVSAAHPELRMAAIDDLWPTERFYFRSDHYNFARRGIPILFFFNGTHEDYHQPTDTADKIDAEKEARILKLVFHLGLAVGNADTRPQWNPKSYEQIVEKKYR
jgi:hypothetical protein